MAWTKPTISEISVGLEINSMHALRSNFSRNIISKSLAN